MHNQEDSAKTILDEFEKKVIQNSEKEVLQELERMLVKDMKVFIGKLFYEKRDDIPKLIYPKIVQEIYISQEDEVYIRDQNDNLYTFDSVIFLKKIA